jgi:hypothetical protein
MSRYKYSGRGVAQRWMTPPGLLIFNFDSGSAQLKMEHRDGLQSWVVPELQHGAHVAIFGMADRVGTVARNQHLSEQRAIQTLAFLRSAVSKDFRASRVVGLGELEAKVEGYRDNVAEPRFRSVLVVPSGALMPAHVPPKTDLAQFIEKEILPGTDWLDYVSRGLDIGIGVGGFLETLPWEEMAELAGKIGFFLTVVASVVQLPILWHSVHEQNLKNGGMQGFWEAMQDMANQFSDPSLGTTPLSKWPPLRVPQARTFGIPDTDLPVNEREWMDGRREGCQFAFRLIEKVDQHPVTVKVKGKDQILNGRQLLQNMASQYGSTFGDELHKVIDRKLLDKAGTNWPLRK